MDLRKLKTLIDLVSESNVSELEITEAEGKVRIVKAGAPGVAAQPMMMMAHAPAPAPAVAAPVAGAPAAAPVVPDAGALELLSLQAARESAMAQASASLLGKKCMV